MGFSGGIYGGGGENLIKLRNSKNTQRDPGMGVERAPPPPQTPPPYAPTSLLTDKQRKSDQAVCGCRIYCLFASCSAGEEADMLQKILLGSNENYMCVYISVYL